MLAYCAAVCLTQESNAAQAARLDDAAAMLDDKDRLEETVKKQHALIEQRGQELKLVKAQLDGKEAALQKAKCVKQLSLCFLHPLPGLRHCAISLCQPARCTAAQLSTTHTECDFDLFVCSPAEARPKISSSSARPARSCQYCLASRGWCRSLMPGWQVQCHMTGALTRQLRPASSMQASHARAQDGAATRGSRA